MPAMEWTDDPTISDDERLWRRVHPKDIKFDSEGTPTLSSATFRPSDRLSVDIASKTNTENALVGYPEHSLAEFTAGVARSFECIVIRDELPANHAHALVINNKRNDGRLSKSQARDISNQSEIIVLRGPEEGSDDL